jgi:hypothetical protein
MEDELFANFAIPGPGPVPAVDPEDLRNVWELMQKVKVELSKIERLDPPQLGRAISYDLRGLGVTNLGCSPGANSGAVWCRMEILDLLRHTSRFGMPLSEKIFLLDIDGKPSDAVFRAMAIVPVMGIPRDGPPIHGLPIDVEELHRLIQMERADPTP